jgi:hypothetical protein
LAAVLALFAAGCRDTVVGGVLNEGGMAGYLNAQSGPSGENANGIAQFGSPDSTLAPRWDLKVTCISATAHTAILGFQGWYATFYGWGEVYPTAGLIRAVDGGGKASGLDSLEFATVTGAQDGDPIPGPTTCSSYPGGYTPNGGPIVNSQDQDLVVTDSPPLPKD